MVGDALIPGLQWADERAWGLALLQALLKLVFFSFKSRIVGLSLITMDTKQIESRICARDLVFKCLRKSGRISCRESGKDSAAVSDFFFFLRQKFVEIGCPACLFIKIWLPVPIAFQHNLIHIFCFTGASIWSIKGKLG